MIGSLATGYGGLDLAAEHVLGLRTAWVADNDPGAAKILAARFPDVPNLSDVTAVDWTRVEPIDVLTAGYPCQPFSHAGKRAGADDPRNLWPHVLRAVRELRPRLVLLENVAGHLSLGFGRVLGDLAEIGYDARWTCLRLPPRAPARRRARRRNVGTQPHHRRVRTLRPRGDTMTDQRDTPRTDAGNDSGDLAHEAQREIDRERDQRDTPDPGKFFGALAPTRTLSNADTPDTRARCTCACHDAPGWITFNHVAPCCRPGDTPDTRTPSAEARLFSLVRDEDVSGVSGTGVVADGIEFPDGAVALRWRSAWPTSVVFHDRGMASVEAVHGHGGKTRIVFPGQGSDAPSAPNRAPTDAHVCIQYEGGGFALDCPHPSHRAAPIEGTADRDALVERLRLADGPLAKRAADALEDLTRERDKWKATWQRADREWAYDRRRLIPSLARLKAERDAAERQVAAVRALCGQWKHEHTLTAENLAYEIVAALDTAPEDRGSGEDAAALQESEFAAGLFAEAAAEARRLDTQGQETSPE